jgi:hypothetical protein
VPAFQRAIDGIKNNPGLSNVQIAEKAGVSEMTVRRAKGSTHVEPGARVTGKDGNTYPAKRKTREDGIPTIDNGPKGKLWDDQDDREEEGGFRSALSIAACAWIWAARRLILVWPDRRRSFMTKIHLQQGWTSMDSKIS